MAAPDNPSPYPGYTKVQRCPECGGFVSQSFARVGYYRIECENCGHTDVIESDRDVVSA